MGAETGGPAATTTKNKTKDLDAVTKKRSAITAAPAEPKKYGTEKTLGRRRQR
jgi:hypothetical protein